MIKLNKDKVNQILFDLDPMGFIKMGKGSFIEEYQYEAQEIESKFNDSKDQSVAALKDIISEVFDFWFTGYKIGSNEEFHKIAETLLVQAIG